jgi:hypothetical protein
VYRNSVLKIYVRTFKKYSKLFSTPPHLSLQGDWGNDQTLVTSATPTPIISPRRRWSLPSAQPERWSRKMVARLSPPSCRAAPSWCGWVTSLIELGGNDDPYTTMIRHCSHATHFTVAMGLIWPVTTVIMRHTSDGQLWRRRPMKSVATGESWHQLCSSLLRTTIAMDDDVMNAHSCCAHFEDEAWCLITEQSHVPLEMVVSDSI